MSTIPYQPWQPQPSTTLPSWNYPWTVYRVCPKCKQQIAYLCDKPFTHCPYCGASLDVCPHCGKPLYEDC